VNYSDPFGLCARPGRPCPPIRPGLFGGAALAAPGRLAEAALDRVSARGRAVMGTFAAEATATVNGVSRTSVRLEASSSAIAVDAGLFLRLQDAVPGGTDANLTFGGLVQAEVTVSAGDEGVTVTGVGVTIGVGLGRTASGKQPRPGGAVAVPGAEACSGNDCQQSSSPP
jgi:hypothetical protein